MKKYIQANKLLAMCREDIELFGEPQGDIMEWVSRIVEECPPVDNIVRLPLGIGQSIWTIPDGVHGIVESMYVGRKGVQRMFARLDNGEKINFTPKGIHKDVTAKDPAQG